MIISRSLRTVAIACLALICAGCSESTSPPSLDGPAETAVGIDAAPGREATLADGPRVDAAVTDATVSDALVPDAPHPDTIPPDALQPDKLSPDAPIPPLTLSVTYPPRAAMLTGTAAITVTGKVVGPLTSLDTLTVNGTAVTPTSTGAFSFPMTSAWGLNLVTVECLDKAGRMVNVAQSYHYSTKYWGMQATSPSSIAVSDGVVARLYSKAIDDSQRSTINDLATILEKVVNATDLDSQIPSTLVSGSVGSWPFEISYKVVKNGTLTYSPISLTLSPRSGGVHLTASASSMSLPVKMTSPVSVSGTVNISNLSIVGNIDIVKSSGGALSVSVPSLTVSYSSLSVSMGSGIIGSVLSAVVSGITSLFKNTITSNFASRIKSALPAPIKSFLSGFKMSTSLTLPSQLGSKTLSIYSTLDQIAFDASGGNLTLAAAVYGTQGITSAKLGSIGASGTYTPSTTSSKAMALGLRYDCLNQALCATWFTGALKQDLTSLVLSYVSLGSLPFTVQGLTLTVDALLPPIIMPGTKGYDFDIGVGDLQVDAELKLTATDSIKAKLYASIVVGGDVSLSSKNEIVIQLATTPHRVEIEVSSLTYQGSSFPLPGQLSQALKELVVNSLPKLVPSIIQQFPIPTIDLSALGGSYGIPAGTVLKLSGATLTQQNNHLVLTGDLN